MSEDTYDNGNPWILNKMIALSERLLESDKSANILITILILLTLIPAFGIGILVTRGAAPIETTQSSD